MANTYIDTNTLPHTKTPEGEYVEVLNNVLCGARNVVGTLRWVKAGERYDAANDARTNQLIYLMEGDFYLQGETVTDPGVLAWINSDSRILDSESVVRLPGRRNTVASRIGSLESAMASFM